MVELRTRQSREVVVAAVTGSLTAPERLVLGSPAVDGSLVFAGTTGPLNRAQQHEIAPLLSPAAAGPHPWPPDMPTPLAGTWASSRRRPMLRVKPVLVVEIDADAAYPTTAPVRHLCRLIRLRTDLHPDDLTPTEIPGPHG